LAEKLHIIQVSPCFVDLKNETGGVANVVRVISLSMRQKGHAVSLICSNTELGSKKSEEKFYVSKEGIRVYIVDQTNSKLFGPRKKIKSTLYKLARDYPKQKTVAHVHTCFNNLTECAMDFFFNNKIPFIFSPHGKLSPNMLRKHRFFKNLWWNFFSGNLVRAASCIGLFAEKERLLFKKLLLNNPYEIIPNGFAPISIDKTLFKNINYKYILYLGYLDPRKQPDFLVRAFAKSKASSSFKLLFVGPDSYNFKNTIFNEAIKFDVKDKIVFWGAAYGEEKWKILSAATCLCLPSLAEGHPIVLSEALGASIPSIYSSNCNFSEIALEGAGIELNDFDEYIWAEAIDNIVFDYKLRRKMINCASRLKSRYTWDKVVGKWEFLYLRESRKLSD
jgi:glycosyltransferase involved in cell wall biosynthesis